MAEKESASATETAVAILSSSPDLSAMALLFPAKNPFIMTSKSDLMLERILAITYSSNSSGHGPSSVAGRTFNDNSLIQENSSGCSIKSYGSEMVSPNGMVIIKSTKKSEEPVLETSLPPDESNQRAGGNPVLFATRKRTSNNKNMNGQSYNFTKFKTTRKYISNLASDHRQLDVLLTNPSFVSILRKQIGESNALSSDMNVFSKDGVLSILFSSRRYSAVQDDDFLVDVLALAFMEMKQLEENMEKMDRVVMATQEEKDYILQQATEREINQRVKSGRTLDRTLSALVHITQRRKKEIEAQEEAITLFKAKEAAKAETAKAEALQYRSTIDDDLREHQRRRDENAAQKESELLSNYERNKRRFEKSVEAKEKSDRENLQNLIEKRQSKTSKFKNISDLNESQFKERASDAYRMKKVAFEKNYGHTLQSKEHKTRARRTKDSRLEYRAEQKRRLLALEKESRHEVIQKQAEKIDMKTEIGLVLKIDRPLALQKIKDGIGKRHNRGDNLIEITPGPGDYSPRLPHKNPAGALIGCRLPPARPSTTPGPMDYHPDGDRRSTRGSVPFQDRGKTDVDWTMLTAARIPGVGSYDISGDYRSTTRGSVPFQGRGTTDTDRRVRIARDLPGVGDYELAPPTSPIRTGSRTGLRVHSLIESLERGTFIHL